MRISDWSSDVCSSDLLDRAAEQHRILPDEAELRAQIDRRMLAAVEPVDEDIARLGRVKPAEQAPERRLALRDAAAGRDPLTSTDERPVGIECVRTWISRWSRDH